MKLSRINSIIAGLFILFHVAGCKVPAASQVPGLDPSPSGYCDQTDSVNMAETPWRSFFRDSNLVRLIDTALHNNFDVRETIQEIEVARSHVRMRDGQLLPSVSAGAAIGVGKVGKYTSQGAGDASAEITPGKVVPEILPELFVGLQTTWEADIWGKLHNARKAAFTRYLSSVEARNFVTTNLVAEIANSYYELLALDNQLVIIREAILLQQRELEVVKVQKQAAVVSELAVKQFEAQVYNSQSMEFDVLQRIAETENRINLLLGRYPQKIARDTVTFNGALPMQVQTGIPSQLLKNRPDIRQAEYDLSASHYDVEVARAEFLPSFGITGMLGFQAFKPRYLFTTPESIAFSLIGDIAAPLINRNAIKAEFNKASAMQLQAMYNYQKAVLNGYIEVATQLSNIHNLDQFYAVKSREAEALKTSIGISTDLFRSARATYLEVLMTQRDALSARLELVEARKNQFNAITNIYKALGGGWR